MMQCHFCSSDAEHYDDTGDVAMCPDHLENLTEHNTWCQECDIGFTGTALIFSYKGMFLCVECYKKRTARVLKAKWSKPAQRYGS